MPITIHNRQYITVAERLQMAKEQISNIMTEVIPSNTHIVIKAIVDLKSGGRFTGISAANPSKAIEKMSPYEVAETSAVGRALGFAGYGAVEGIASADEMVKAGATGGPTRAVAKRKWAETIPEPTEPPFDDKGNFTI